MSAGPACDARREADASAVTAIGAIAPYVSRLRHLGDANELLYTLPGAVKVMLNLFVLGATKVVMVSVRNAVLWQCLKEGAGDRSPLYVCNSLAAAFGDFWGDHLKSQMLGALKKELLRFNVEVPPAGKKKNKNKAKKTTTPEPMFVDPTGEYPDTPDTEYSWSAWRETPENLRPRESPIPTGYAETEYSWRSWPRGAGSEAGDQEPVEEGVAAHNVAKVELLSTRQCRREGSSAVPIGRRAKINVVRLPHVVEDEQELVDSCEQVQELATLFQKHVHQLIQVYEEEADLNEPTVMDVFRMDPVEEVWLDPKVSHHMMQWVCGGVEEVHSGGGMIPRALAVGLRHGYAALLAGIAGSQDEKLLTAAHRALQTMDALQPFQPAQKKVVARSLLESTYNPWKPQCVSAYVGLCGTAFTGAVRDAASDQHHWATEAFESRTLLLQVVHNIAETVRYWGGKAHFNGGVVYEASWALEEMCQGAQLPNEIATVVEAALESLEDTNELRAYRVLQTLKKLATQQHDDGGVGPVESMAANASD